MLSNSFPSFIQKITRSTFLTTFLAIETNMVESLVQSVTDIEIKKTIFNMHPTKAPSIDDLHEIFFQSQWDLVGP